MRILVLGATGRTGRHVVDQALARGHEVSGLVRSASDVKTAFTAIAGDPTEADVLASILPRHDIVISCLGQRVRTDGGILQRSAEAMRDAMKRTSGRPLFVVSQGLLFPSRNPLIFLLRWILASHVRDSRAMEAVLRATGIDWMIVRPPRLLDGGKSEGYRIAVDARPSGPASMQRSDLAAFLLDQAEERRHSQKVIGITAAK